MSSVSSVRNSDYAHHLGKGKGEIQDGPMKARLGFQAFLIFLSPATALAGMADARFALDYKPKFVASKAIPNLCDNPATTTIEPNYSPNYTNTPCYNYDTWCEPRGAGQVYVVVAKATEGVSAASFGLTYGGSSHTGIDPTWVTWTPCADGLSFPSGDGVHGLFPNPGGGLRITWNPSTSCQTQVIGSAGVHAVVGVLYVYAYSSDVLRITPNNNVGPTPELAVSNCAGVVTDLFQIWGPYIWPSLVGTVGFIDQRGSNPCALYGPELKTLVSSPCTTPVRPSTWGKVKSRYKEER
jgi:hypothetical protein